MWYPVTKTVLNCPGALLTLKLKDLTVCFDYFRISKNQILPILGYELFRAEMFPIVHFWDRRWRHCVLHMKAPSLLTHPNSARLLPC